jgi:hypothetical protein
MDSAFREAELGNREQARHDVAAALALASSRDTQIEAALISHESGISLAHRKCPMTWPNAFPPTPCSTIIGSRASTQQ